MREGRSLYLIFRLGDQPYGLAIEHVAEVLRMAALLPLPHAPAWLLGCLNLRGHVIPVLDLGRRLGLAGVSIHLDTPVIVACAEGRSIGLVVASVCDVEALPEPEDGRWVTHLDDQLVLLLDPTPLVAESYTWLERPQAVAAPWAEPHPSAAIP